MLYCGVNINVGTEGGSRQELDDTYTALRFISSATNQKYISGSLQKLYLTDFHPVISDTQRKSVCSFHLEISPVVEFPFRFRNYSKNLVNLIFLTPPLAKY